MKIEVLRQQLITQVPDSSVVSEVRQGIKVHTAMRLTPTRTLGPRACLALQSRVG